MSSPAIVCRFFLRIDYARGVFDWYSRPAEIAVFYFGRQVSDVEVYQRMKRAGFSLADEWCLIASYRAKEAFPIVGEPSLFASKKEIRKRMSTYQGCWQGWHRFLGVKWLGKPQKYTYPFIAIFRFQDLASKYYNR